MSSPHSTTASRTLAWSVMVDDFRGIKAVTDLPADMWLEVLLRLTCSDYDAFLTVFRAVGLSEATIEFTRTHALGDDDEGDEHHQPFVEAEARSRP